jgi:hypothetical protein
MVKERTMRSILVGAISSLVAVACGGEPPPPANDVVSYKGPQTKGSDMASVEVDGGSGVKSSKIEVSSEPSPAQTATTEAPKPQEPEDPSMVFHQIPPPVVNAVVKPVAAKVKQCFRDVLKRDPSAEGEVNVRFVITHEGTVVDAKDNGSSMTDEDVTKCIAAVIKTLKFGVQDAPGGAFGIYSIHLSN